MASSTESPSVDVYITSASQTRHLSAIIAAAGTKKVNIYFHATSGSDKQKGSGDNPDAHEDNAQKVEPLDDTTETFSVSKTGFSDLPLEMQIEIFKLVFIRDTPRRLMVSRVKNRASTCPKHTTEIVKCTDWSPQLSAQLLRVSRSWNQYGSAMIFENTFYPVTTRTLANASSHARKYNMPGLKLLKHVQLRAWDLNMTNLDRLRPFKHIKTIALIDECGFISHEKSDLGDIDPITDCKDKMLEKITIYFRELFKRSLQSVKYTFKTNYTCSRESSIGDLELQEHDLEMEYVLSSDAANGIDVVVKSDKIKGEWVLSDEAVAASA